ncbi:MJ0042-type zinc finger domain-containing protein [Thermogemmata fonticola]|uniref:Zinc finger/thioredoxin putative domain-containing protein n=1 Tax=Thermogemmata fonticola TaxID=2755323 RepID=A0A7V9ABK2_9BACT|nr:MJ0042-type zinc finger domain-containing protein [Thermogemmata fonticola]MBA2226143.1 hypothetical protein [Thermogemmata fonticola]
MNNLCPACGAAYNIRPTDVGRKVRCKRCGAALVVAPEGLVAEAAAGAAPTDPSAVSPPVPSADPPPAPAPAEAYMEIPVPSLVASPYQRPYPPNNFLAAIGGIPTVLFALGVFFVILFTFMTPIGEAATRRAQARVDLLKWEQDLEIRRLKDKDIEKAAKIAESYLPKLVEASSSAEYTRISNIRSQWYDRYGQLLGFLLLAFGCIGYLRTEQPLVLRIVAAVTLSFMLMVIFVLGVSGGCNSTPVAKMPSPPKLPFPPD